jgi:hypothetical protein
MVWDGSTEVLDKLIDLGYDIVVKYDVDEDKPPLIISGGGENIIIEFGDEIPSELL